MLDIAPLLTKPFHCFLKLSNELPRLTPEFTYAERLTEVPWPQKRTLALLCGSERIVARLDRKRLDRAAAERCVTPARRFRLTHEKEGAGVFSGRGECGGIMDFEYCLGMG
jgi:hypothetical protein